MLWPSLETLSKEELLLIAEKIGLLVNEDMARDLLIEEVQEAWNEEIEFRKLEHASAMHVFEKKHSSINDFDFAPPFQSTPSSSLDQGLHDISLPELKSDTAETFAHSSLYCLVRDPSWAYAFWELPDILQGDNQNRAQIILRVCEEGEGATTSPGGRSLAKLISAPPDKKNQKILPPKNLRSETSPQNGSQTKPMSQALQNKPKKNEDYFDIHVGLDDHEWYINLPRPEMCFSLLLLGRSKPSSQIYKILARTPIMKCPRRRASVEGLNSSSRALYELSLEVN